jgi:hypothetical protein
MRLAASALLLSCCVTAVTAVFIASPFFYHVEKKQLPESAEAWHGVCLRLGSDSLLENLSHPGEPVTGLPGEEANDAAPRSGQAVEIWYLRCNNDSDGGQSMTPSEKRSPEGSAHPHPVRVATAGGGIGGMTSNGSTTR